jgi:hypothetical protein
MPLECLIFCDLYIFEVMANLTTCLNIFYEQNAVSDMPNI